MDESTAACYFCGQAIRDEGVDPVAILVIADWRHQAERHEDDVREQTFYTHAECFRRAGASGFASYIAVF